MEEITVRRRHDTKDMDENSSLSDDENQLNMSDPKSATDIFQQSISTKPDNLKGAKELPRMSSSEKILERDRLSDAAKLLQENEWTISCQIFIPYIIAGIGMVGAGTVLNIVKRWPVFIDVSEIIVLVPALLGLKGNLEMTLASRLSTQANLGVLDSTAECKKLIGGNLALTQIQAVVVGLLAAVFAVTLTWLQSGVLHISHALLLCSSSVATASLTSLLLGSIVSMVVITSRKCSINPDNIATPIAGSLGDLSAILILAAIASLIHASVKDGSSFITVVILLVELLILPYCWNVSAHNVYTCDALYSGWVPVVSAMIISSLGGLVLDRTITHYEGLALFQPVINGVGGNLVSIQASRLSTGLHLKSQLGQQPSRALYGCASPMYAFCSSSRGAVSARALLFLVIPGQLIFAYIIHWSHHNEMSLSSHFIVLYVLVALIQVAILLLMAHWLVHHQWTAGSDPDTAAIPYLTAVGDLLGAVLLAAAFFIESLTAAAS